MIDALVAGKLYGQPKAKTAKNGNQFATAKVRAAAGDGESLFVGVIAFSQTAVTALLALEDGDSVALSGELTPKVWVDRDGNAKPAADLVAAVVLTTYHVGRSRRARTRVVAPPGMRCSDAEPTSRQPGLPAVVVPCLRPVGGLLVAAVAGIRLVSRFNARIARARGWRPFYLFQKRHLQRHRARDAVL